MHGPPAVSTLYMCNLCLERTTVIDLIVCENTMWMGTPRTVKNTCKIKLWSFLLCAALVHDVGTSDTKLALIYSEIGSSEDVLLDRIL